MNSKIKAAVVITVTAVLAGSCGAAVGSASTTEGTVTKTVEVEVPGPTVTKEVEVPGPTKTVTKEVEVTPAACSEAIADARTFAGQVSEFTDISLQYLDIIPEAYEAGSLYQDVTPLLNKMDRLMKKNEALNRRTSVTVDSFNENAEKCEVR